MSLKNEQRVTLGKDHQQISRKITIPDTVDEAEILCLLIMRSFVLSKLVKIHIETFALTQILRQAYKIEKAFSLKVCASNDKSYTLHSDAFSTILVSL